MRPYIENWKGRHIPKQYCAFVGTRSMLEHTWGRADFLTAPHHKITVLARSHESLVPASLDSPASGRFIFQPANRNTAAGIFLPLTYVRSLNPEATVILYPSDHFIYPEQQFMRYVRSAVRATEHWTDRIILLGATPTSLELDYGWIKKRRRLGWSSAVPLWSVDTFLEKPVSCPISAISDSEWVWNTMVVIGKLKTLWDMGWECFPILMERFSALAEVLGTQRERPILEAIYDDMPDKNFSADLLEHAEDHLAVMEMEHVLWSDWGRPERIENMLTDIGKFPNFFTNSFAQTNLNGHARKDVRENQQQAEEMTK